MTIRVTNVTEDVMTPVRKFYRVYNEQDMSLWNDAMAEDYIGNVNGQVVPNREIGAGFVGSLLKAFPNITYALEDTITSGDKVVTRWKATGTHDGDLFGMPPTHKDVTMLGMTIFQVKDGKIAALWDVWDQAGLMAQLNG